MNESIIIGSERGTPRGPWRAILLVAVIAAVAGGAWYLLGRAPAPVNVPVVPVATTTPSATSTAAMTKVALVFLDNDAPGAGTGDYGCDGIVTVEVSVPPTSAPITAAMNALFDEATTTDLVPGNFVADQDDLAFEKASVEGSVARVYLVGQPVSGGVCDDPRLGVQIRETVLANAPAVETVEIFLNGEPYVTPSGR